MSYNPMIIIYGVNLQAEALCEYIMQEKKGEVIGFMVDKEYKVTENLRGLPVYNTDEVFEEVDNRKVEICLSFGYKNMIKNRQEKYNLCKDNGFKIFSYISSSANIYTDSIGEGVNIYPGTIIAPHVKIGAGTFIECGVTISHHTEIGRFNFIAPGVTICGKVSTGGNCFIGAGAKLINGVKLDEYVFVGAGAKVSTNQNTMSTVLPERSNSTEKNSFKMMEYMFKNDKNKQ